MGNQMRKLLRYMKSYWKAALLAPLFMLLEVAMDVAQPTLMASIVDKGIAPILSVSPLTGS